MRKLIESGADPNYKNKKGAKSYLHFAAEYVQPQIARVLLEGGADPAYVTEGKETPLEYCQKLTAGIERDDEGVVQAQIDATLAALGC